MYRRALRRQLVPRPLAPRRPIGVAPIWHTHSQRQLASFALKVLARVGITSAVGGGFIYTIDQATLGVRDQLSKLKDFANGAFDLAGDFFKGMGADKGSGDGGSDGGSSSQNSNSAGGDGGGSGDTATAVGATAAAVGLLKEEDDDFSKDPFEEEDDELVLEADDEEEPDFEHDETDDIMMNLSKQMIELRNMLALIDHDTIRLPLIVVVGSQLLGKSSVLEAIVGQEFLPKGNNMVTRRPIEMTLVNTPDAAAETVDFPALKLYNITDFNQVQKQLYDLNMAVPMTEAILPDPIQVTIRSPRVPDLSLVDLPGYIQVEAADQPTALKQKIRSICMRYLEAPNIILAISAADVDLANSAALRAAKLADPNGDRTIGVVTKLDLVEPQQARAILTNRKYPLRMGYVGVITKAPTGKQALLFSRKQVGGYQAFVAQQNYEYHYLKEHKNAFVGTVTSTRNLKKKLVKVLERSMAASLKPTYMALQQELEETLYQFKVQFNDRSLTPQMYLANNLDTLKLAVKELSHKFTRLELRLIVKNELDQRAIDLIAEKYWNLPTEAVSPQTLEHDIRELTQLTKDDPHWAKVLENTCGALTKLGVGRLLTNLTTRAILQEVENLIDNTQLRSHPLAKQAVMDAAKLVLSSKYYLTLDQVENLIKPYKYEIDVEDREWQVLREHANLLLKEELKQCEQRMNDLKHEVGGRKLAQVMTYLEKVNSRRLNDPELHANEALGFSQALIHKGKEGLFLKERASLLKMRQSFVKNSKKCRRKDGKYQCPEVFLDIVTSKITQTAVLFLNVELLSDFYYNFPRELDDKFFTNLTKEDVEKFAKEDPKIARHIELQERKDLLETALTKLDSVLAFQRTRGQLTDDDKEKKSFVPW